MTSRGPQPACPAKPATSLSRSTYSPSARRPRPVPPGRRRQIPQPEQVSAPDAMLSQRDAPLGQQPASRPLFPRRPAPAEHHPRCLGRQGSGHRGSHGPIFPRILPRRLGARLAARHRTRAKPTPSVRQVPPQAGSVPPVSPSRRCEGKKEGNNEHYGHHRRPRPGSPAGGYRGPGFRPGRGRLMTRRARRGTWPWTSGPPLSWRPGRPPTWPRRSGTPARTGSGSPRRAPATAPDRSNRWAARCCSGRRGCAGSALTRPPAPPAPRPARCGRT